MPTNLHDEFAIRGSDKGFSDRWLHWLQWKPIHRSHGITLHEGAVSSGVCHITGRRRKRIGLEVPSEYNYYCGATKHLALIQDLALIFVIMLFPPATK